MNFPVPAPLHRWLSLLLAALLALGPFLHSHFGASHDTGFHLDGVHAVHAVHPGVMVSIQAPDEESPAMGVAASLPQTENDGLPDLTWALLLTVLPVLPLRRQPLPRAQRQPSGPSTLYRAGLPPPGLAPPAA